jgi:hypothetical protein
LIESVIQILEYVISDAMFFRFSWAFFYIASTEYLKSAQNMRFGHGRGQFPNDKPQAWTIFAADQG